MKEYRVKKGLKMLIYVLASLAIVLYGGLTIVLIIPPFNTTTQEMHQSMPGLWLLGLFLAMVISMIVVIVSIKKRKVIITNEAVISHSLLGKTELKLYEIKGFRLDAVPKYPQFQHIIIDAFDTKKKSIRINPFLENMGELRANLNLKLKNLDNQKIENLKEKFKNEEQEILKNNDFGLSIEERES
jgi:glucan phosphoethanolaminetransferase (alkaline phosphatase superfamily)